MINDSFLENFNGKKVILLTFCLDALVLPRDGRAPSWIIGKISFLPFKLSRREPFDISTTESCQRMFAKRRLHDTNFKTVPTCVTTILQWAPLRLAIMLSRMNCGTCVVLPHPVLPLTMITWWRCTAATISAAREAMGRRWRSSRLWRNKPWRKRKWLTETMEETDS